MKFKRVLFSLTLFLAVGGCVQDQNLKDNRPNIVIIIGDDIGYSDLGCYGAEIQTPNLDSLAYGGMRFRQFYNMAKCNPTRSSLITGLYKGDERSQSFVRLLRDAGYSAIMSGKEHFDQWVPRSAYFAETFENSFTFWATTEYFVPPSGQFQRPFFLNGKQLTAEEIEADLEPKYKTDFITDYALNWLDEVMEREAPFLLLLPYHAAHYPLQARAEDIAKYQGKYMEGWDSIRQRRYERMKEMGILEASVQLSPAEDNTNQFRGASYDGWPEIRANWNSYYPWEEMNEEEMKKKDLEMAVFAAIIDRMDQNIGRVINRLKKADKFENTLIIYFTDNGSCPFDSNVNFDIPPGPAESYRCLSPPWANVGNTPFRLYKQNGHEGGALTHFIAHWPKEIDAGQITNEIGHVVDLFPTFAQIGGATYPDSVMSRPSIPLSGKSLLPVFKGNKREDSPFFISGHKEAFRMFRMGDWKMVRQNSGEWELYHLAEDRTEMFNLRDSLPEKFQEMASAYEQYLRSNEKILEP